MPTIEDAPEKLPDNIRQRLECLLEPWQWSIFLEVCEDAKSAGAGFAEVKLTFSENRMTMIEGSFTRKPRKQFSVRQ